MSVRLNLIISDAVKGSIDRLAQSTGATSNAEVIRRALAIYDTIIEHQKEGGEMIFKNKNGVMEKVKVI